jgi:outer membrane protein assembly factor BamA
MMRPISLLFFFIFSIGQLECVTLTKVKIKSSMLAKDRFLAYYSIEPGDQFSKEKHEISLAAIERALKDEAYLKPKITGHLESDKKRNSVIATVGIEPGARYIISQVQVLFAQNQKIADQLKESVKNKIVGQYFLKNVLDEEGKFIRALVLRAGAVEPRIALSSERDDLQATVSLTYTISCAKKRQMLFSGNSFFSADRLLDEVLALEAQGGELPEILVAQELEDLYRTKGFASVSIEARGKPGYLIFKIREGSRYKPGKIVLSESLGLPAQSVIKKLHASLETLDYYDEELIGDMLTQARQELAHLGFWPVEITQSNITSQPINHTISYEVTVSPQPQKLIDGIVILDHPHLWQEGPFASWHALKQQRILNPEEVDEQRVWLVHHFRREGYLSAHIDYSIEHYGHGTFLVWKIDTSQGPAHFGPTHIRGLHLVKPQAIVRELCFHQGQVWNAQKLEESLSRLKGLGVFESVSVIPEGQGQVVPITVRCIEEDPYELRTRLGMQFVSKSFTNISWSTWKVGGSFIWKNPTGYADRFIFDADWTRYTLNFGLSYEMPWLGPCRVRTLFKVYSDRFDQPLISSAHHRLYKEAHDGASVLFTHANPYWQNCVKLGFEVNKLSGISDSLARTIQFEPTLVDRNVFYLYAEPSITFEHFDNKVDPCRGYFTTLSLKAMVPPQIHRGWFLKAQLEQSLFYPLFRSVIGAVRWRVGHIFNAQFNTILPTERFYLGGANSLRGYETNMVPPLNDILCDDRCFWVPIGGKSMANVNVEVRFPLYRQFGGVIFTDMGVLAQNRLADIAANQWLGASGFGLRYASPLGPLRFDIGWKWKRREPKDKPYAFFITFGHAF